MQARPPQQWREYLNGKYKTTAPRRGTGKAKAAQMPIRFMFARRAVIVTGDHSVFLHE
jgi:hypothetical protein